MQFANAVNSEVVRGRLKEWAQPDTRENVIYKAIKQGFLGSADHQQRGLVDAFVVICVAGIPSSLFVSSNTRPGNTRYMTATTSEYRNFRQDIGQSLHGKGIGITVDPIFSQINIEQLQKICDPARVIYAPTVRSNRAGVHLEALLTSIAVSSPLPRAADVAPNALLLAEAFTRKIESDLGSIPFTTVSIVKHRLCLRCDRLQTSEKTSLEKIVIDGMASCTEKFDFETALNGWCVADRSIWICPYNPCNKVMSTSQRCLVDVEEYDMIAAETQDMRLPPASFVRWITNQDGFYTLWFPYSAVVWDRATRERFVVQDKDEWNTYRAEKNRYDCLAICLIRYEKRGKARLWEQVDANRDGAPPPNCGGYPWVVKFAAPERE